MTEHQNEAPPSDFNDLVALLRLAELASTELAKLEPERRRLQHELERANAEFARQLDAGQLPVAELVELARIDEALSGNERAVEVILTRFQTVFSSPPPRGHDGETKAIAASLNLIG